MWFLLFVKQLPVMAIAELKEIVVPRNKFAHAQGIDTAGHHEPFGVATPGEFD